MNQDIDGRQLASGVAEYPLLQALLHRRSRRFGKGMHLDGDPLRFQSQRPPQSLSPSEEAALAFAACGISGYALAELPYGPSEESDLGDGNIMVHFTGRTVASGDALHAVTMFVINDDGVWMLKRPQDFTATEIPSLVEAAHEGRLLETYRRSRVRVADGRRDVPRRVPYTPSFNQWSTNMPGTTCFLPVNELSGLYINVLLTMFDPKYGYFLVDDCNGFRAAGIGSFGRSQGGHLFDDPQMGRSTTISFAESWLQEFTALEQGEMHQNLGLMTQALGLGGFPFFAAHPWGWLESLGFRMEHPKVSNIHSVGGLTKTILKLLGKDLPVPTAVGLEQDGETLIKPYCPPYYESMEEAVLAFVDHKYHPGKGTFRNSDVKTAWKDGATVQSQIPPYSEEAIAATISYCEYVYSRYGRFPANTGPFRTVLAYQAHHLDPDFYERYYESGALTPAHHEHPDDHDESAVQSSE